MTDITAATETKIRQTLIDVALGRTPADTLLRVDRLLDTNTGLWREDVEIAIHGTRIAFVGPRGSFPGTAHETVSKPGLSAIPAPYRQAAAIDGASRLAVFRHIELPRIAGALSIVLLLRFVDSFMIYTEAFAINAGGPQDATTFVSLELGEDIKSFSYGRAAARAMLDFLIVLAVAWAFIRIRAGRSGTEGFGA